MAKYIIDVGEGYIRHGLERTLAIPVRINEHEDHWMDTRIPVTPYAEPDLEQVRKEAYDKGMGDAEMLAYELYSPKIYEAYQHGLSDAWEAARKIADMPYGDGEKIFGVSGWHIIEKYTASEVIEKLKAYEQEQEEFKVGDEFENENDKKFVVLKMNGKEIDRYIDSDGRTYHMNVKYKVMRKTGRTFPEVATVLEKMREGQE